MEEKLHTGKGGYYHTVLASIQYCTYCILSHSHSRKKNDAESSVAKRKSGLRIRIYYNQDPNPWGINKIANKFPAHFLQIVSKS